MALSPIVLTLPVILSTFISYRPKLESPHAFLGCNMQRPRLHQCAPSLHPKRDLAEKQKVDTEITARLVQSTATVVLVGLRSVRCEDARSRHLDSGTARGNLAPV